MHEKPPINKRFFCYNSCFKPKRVLQCLHLKNQLKKGKRKQAEVLPQVNINERIRAKELRVLTDDGENLGIISKEEAISKAREMEMDLIEISPNANPPVAKIMDYGKFQYDQKKKIKVQKAKAKNVELKNIQIKIGTDQGGLTIKAKQASKWLNEGHRVKLELFLPGRSRYLDNKFLEERLERLQKLVSTDHKVAEEIKKIPKGLSMIIEKSSGSKNNTPEKNQEEKIKEDENK